MTSEREEREKRKRKYRAALHSGHVTYDDNEHELGIELWIDKKKVTLIFKPETALLIPDNANITTIDDIDLDTPDDVFRALAWVFDDENCNSQVVEKDE